MTSRDFSSFVKSTKIQEATRELTPWEIILVVEGASDWHWMYSKLLPKVATIEYDLDGDGGKEFVLRRVKHHLSHSRRVIGIIDRDFEGLLESRNEINTSNVIDTEVHDSEVMVARTQALSQRFEIDLPPHKRSALSVQLEHFVHIQEDAFRATAMFGAVRLCNLLRRSKAQNPFLRKIDIKDAMSFYSSRVNHRHGLDIVDLIEYLGNNAGWTPSDIKSFGQEVNILLNTVKAELKNELELFRGSIVSDYELETFVRSVLSNGHDLMVFVSRGWLKLCKENTSYTACKSCSEILSPSLRDLFDIIRFRSTQLYFKIMNFCAERNWGPIFVG